MPSRTHSSRRANLLNHLAQPENSGLVVTKLSDIRWLTGFTGSSACVVVFDGDVTLFTDGRYTEQSSLECPDISVMTAAENILLEAVQMMVETSAETLKYQSDDLTTGRLTSLLEALPNVSFLPSEDHFQALRAVKSSTELDAIKEALSITETVFEEVRHMIRPGISENALAAEIDFRQRKLGAEKSAFETIVAFGSNTALPHARPGDARLSTSAPILIDFGCVVRGYCSDMTRMLHIGAPSKEFLRAYGSVSSALEAVSASAQCGMTGKELDTLARGRLANDGLAEHFTHSLGHGVGLDIHEWPALSRRGSTPLPEGCVVTFEPGVYLRGAFGIRLENMMVLHQTNAELLNTLSTELIIL